MRACCSNAVALLAVLIGLEAFARDERIAPRQIPIGNGQSSGNAKPQVVDAKAAAFAKAVAENRDRGKGSLEGLRAAIPAVGKACDDCHKDYRLGKD